MKKHTFFFLVIVSFLLSGMLYGGNGDPLTNPVVAVQGMVSDKDSQESLPGVTIQIDGLEKSFYTDADGNFSITELSPGTYTMKVKCISYKDKEIRLAVGNASENKVSIELETVEP
jgi:hypothetical protein